MAKTAEENKIRSAFENEKRVSGAIREYLDTAKSFGFKMDVQEFAAQEVEAYKERLRSEIELECKDLAADRKSTKWLLTRALTIIDTVK